MASLTNKLAEESWALFREIESAGGFLAAAKPETQRPFVVGLMIASALIALSLLYSLFVGGYAGAQWFLWLPIVINACLAVALAWVASKLA